MFVSCFISCFFSVSVQLLFRDRNKTLKSLFTAVISKQFRTYGNYQIYTSTYKLPLGSRVTFSKPRFFGRGPFPYCASDSQLSLHFYKGEMQRSNHSADLGSKNEKYLAGTHTVGYRKNTLRENAEHAIALPLGQK